MLTHMETTLPAISLSEPHLAELRDASAINMDVITARGYRTLPGEDLEAETAELESLGYSRAQVRRPGVFPALLIPLHASYGEISTYQLKPAQPRKIKGRVLKYETPRGSGARIDMPPFTNRALYPDSITEPLWITEGVKKVDSLVSQGVACIGLTGVYNWRNQLGSLGDWEDIPLKGRPVTVCFDADARVNLHVARAMQRLGRWLKSKGAHVYYVMPPTDVAGTSVKGVDDYLAAGGTLEQLRQLVTTTEPDTGTRDGRFTDAYMADTVADEVFSGRYIWTRGMGWMRYADGVWSICDESAAVEAMRQYVIAQYAEALDGARSGLGQPDTERAIDGWRSMLDKRALNRVVSLARGVPGVTRDDAELDADADLLCARNGVVDLRTGALSPHDPDLLMTRVAGADYVPGASHKAWNGALEALTGEIGTWIQTRVGQAATGRRTPDDVTLLLHGRGSNGKSTLTAGIARALGTYHVLVPEAILIGDARRDETMMLRGARYALIEETEERAPLNSTALKKLSSPEMSGHHLYASTVTWSPTHSLVITTNYRPVVTQTDDGTWRRLALVTFPLTYVAADQVRGPNDRVQDPRLIHLIESGDPDVLSAALAWIVDGARRWYDAGCVLPPHPDPVVADTREWRAETDMILKFWDACLVADPDAHVVVGDLVGAYNAWRTEQGMRVVSERVFVPEFEAHGETRAARVEKRRVRRGSVPGLSRPGGGGAQGTDSATCEEDPFAAPTSGPVTPSERPAELPEQYRALLGVRFV